MRYPQGSWQRQDDYKARVVDRAQRPASLIQDTLMWEGSARKLGELNRWKRFLKKIRCTDKVDGRVWEEGEKSEQTPHRPPAWQRVQGEAIPGDGRHRPRRALGWRAQCTPMETLAHPGHIQGSGLGSPAGRKAVAAPTSGAAQDREGLGPRLTAETSWKNW